MTWDAAGMLAGGRGKECTPLDQTANPTRVPLAHAVHVVSVMLPECALVLVAVHLSAARRSETTVVTGVCDNRLPLGAGL